jgi:hypothetical protein
MCFQNPVQARLWRDLKTQHLLGLPSAALLLHFVSFRDFPGSQKNPSASAPLRDSFRFQLLP